MKSLLRKFGVVRIVSNEAWKVTLEEPEPSKITKNPSHQEGNSEEWNVEWIKSQFLYSKGFRGEGMVVGNADTGIVYTHPALEDSYRGTRGNNKRRLRFDHNFNWFDATQIGPLPPQVDPSSSSCVQGVESPCDDHGHGTHTAGTHSGTLQGIGVAPQSKWIGCRNMFAGYGTPATYLGCLEWFTAPTGVNGRGRTDTSKRPHSVGNSYGCPTNEGCSYDTFKDAVVAVRKAGIFMAVSAGNNGRSGCGTVTAPPGLDVNVCSVGATAFKSNDIADYSSKGPVIVDGSGRRKPDIVAPGSSVRSAYPPDSYTSLSGTSMAAPAVAGAVALLWEAVPALKRNVDMTEKVLFESATALYDTAENCGGDKSSTRPNQIFGHGLLDLQAAYEHALAFGLVTNTTAFL